ncbi:MAG: hypothetical protein VB957_01600 [Pseudomonadales bacterium]
MEQRLTGLELAPLLDRLAAANEEFAKKYPGIQVSRQAVHTLYGGANLYKQGIAAKLGGLALKHFKTYAGNANELVQALELDSGSDSADTWHRVYQRTIEKLSSEPVEDQRVDFEDGYGVRADAEEDAHAVSAAEAMAAGMEADDLPPFTGIRIKALTEESKVRALRTLDIFISTLTSITNGILPNPFFVTLPKVTSPEQVAVLSNCLNVLEVACGMEAGTVKIEIMIETVQSVFNPTGECGIPALVDAGDGRVSSAILGTYDYTATCNIASNHQDHRHPSADFARQMMQVSLTGTSVTLCDGITNTMPIPPHKGADLSKDQLLENRSVVHDAWRIHFTNIMHSLKQGFYQSWDLNPAQLPIRYVAVYYFFLSGLADARARLGTFINQAAQASMVGNTFDDAASAQGILNFFVSGISCGALSEEEALATGITLEELHGRSFMTIVENRLQEKSSE